MPSKKDGVMIILSSPSGAGKTTLVKMLSEVDNYEISISHTTRQPRPSEVPNKDYFFIDENEFNRLIKNEEFLEYAKVFNNFYGTTRTPVIDKLNKEKDVLFDIDWQGTQQLSENDGFDLVSIFILPPSKKALETRLKARAQDSTFEVNKRMSQASDEISHYMEYSYVIVNDDLEVASNQVLSILNAERLKRKRFVDLNGFIKFLRS